MKNWFLSKNGAITISVMAFLVFLGRLFLDWRYESHLMGAEGSLQEFLYVLMFLAFAGGWVWGMLAAKNGSKSWRSTQHKTLRQKTVVAAVYLPASFLHYCWMSDLRSRPIYSGAHQPLAQDSFPICGNGIGQR